MPASSKPFRFFCFPFVLASCFLLGACSPAPKFSPSAVDLTGLGYGQDFHLNDPDGHVRSMADFKGKVVLLFFGFTQCPDVCPTALVKAAEVHKLLKEEASRFQVIYITLDPERDTPAILKSYASAFDPSFIALSGDLESTRKTADAFKVFYQKVATGNAYTMDHTAVTYLLDPAGAMRVGIRPAVSAEDIAQDVRTLLHNVS